MNSRDCISVAGSGDSGNRTDCPLLFAQFDEPGGICFSAANSTLMVADTNNHCIKSVRFDRNEVRTLALDWSVISSKVRDDEIRLAHAVVSVCDQISIELKVVFGEDVKLTDAAPSLVELLLPGTHVIGKAQLL